MTNEEARDALARTIARTFPGWNDDTTEPGITDAIHRQAIEDHWEKVNQTCLEQGNQLADAILSSDWLRSRDEKTWDEGCSAAEQYYKRTVIAPDLYKPIPAPVNPYRRVQEGDQRG